MADITCETIEPKKKKSRYPHGEPRDPEKLREIARLKNEENLTWQQIGETLGISRQGACLLYHHWRMIGWFEDEEEGEDEEEKV
jgi:hypothetical protein